MSSSIIAHVTYRLCSGHTLTDLYFFSALARFPLLGLNSSIPVFPLQGFFRLLETLVLSAGRRLHGYKIIKLN